MPFKKGIAKTGGRTEGTPNRTTEQFRELIKNFVSDHWGDIETDFKAVKPVERLQFINNLIRHFLPEPLSLAKLTEDQLKELSEYIAKIYGNDKTD